MGDKLLGTDCDFIIIDDPICPSIDEIKKDEYYKDLISKNIKNSNISILVTVLNLNLISKELKDQLCRTI